MNSNQHTGSVEEAVEVGDCGNLESASPSEGRGSPIVTTWEYKPFASWSNKKAKIQISAWKFADFKIVALTFKHGGKKSTNKSIK